MVITREQALDGGEEEEERESSRNRMEWPLNQGLSSYTACFVIFKSSATQLDKVSFFSRRTGTLAISSVYLHYASTAA